MTENPRKLGIVQHIELALRLAATSEGLTIDEIAEEFEVSPRTAQRMRAALDTVFEIEALKDGTRLRYRLAQRLDPALVAPSRAELSELALAARALADSGQENRAQVLERLHKRLLAALRQRDKLRLAPDLELLEQRQLPIIPAGPRAPGAPGVVAACQQALLADCLLGFDYTSPRGYRLHEVAVRGLLVGARSYLVAAGNDWGDPMLFRIDRISGPRVTEAPAWPDTTFDLEAFAARSFGVFQEDMQDVVLRFDAVIAGEARAFRFHPAQMVQTLRDGRVEVRFESGGLLELAQHLFTWRGMVEVVSPEALIEMFRTELETALKRLPDK
ncbi:helix-turn-helix transcriptional regulator [Acidimangrovimonas pyrenivorans]|uniref:Helix-turn-helix transcriptional regulator n=1 Tax=Acidimangrovimonas pyrenivorans TaxID=2030798 RepID=A0ABV7AKK7_9RHOB